MLHALRRMRSWLSRFPGPRVVKPLAHPSMHPQVEMCREEALGLCGRCGRSGLQPGGCSLEVAAWPFTWPALHNGHQLPASLAFLSPAALPPGTGQTSLSSLQRVKRSISDAQHEITWTLHCQLNCAARPQAARQNTLHSRQLASFCTYVPHIFFTWPFCALENTHQSHSMRQKSVP